MPDVPILTARGQVSTSLFPPMAKPNAHVSCARSYCRSPDRYSSTRRRSTSLTGQHLGNFPQAFTHLALIEAVSMLIQSDHGGNSAPVG